MTRRRCKATTKRNTPCMAAPLKDQDVCLAHADEEVRISTDFGYGPRPGRPPNPKPVEVLREKIENDIEKWLAPYEEALRAERGVVVGNGPEAHVELVPDIPTRMKAADAVLDRIYGKAKQATEITGAGGGPVETAPAAIPEEASWHREALRAAQDLGLLKPAGANGASRNGHG